MGFQRPKKGIVLKKSKNRQLLLVHRDSLNDYLNELPANESGWHSFEIIPAGGNISHDINPLLPQGYKDRQTKIEGPQYRKAG